ncbi:unnamed protein product [Strongylus vulgaris]|uniref:Uncharacterized protein n=1 Tax=Strongylus vulgaris TaxID=40348 RepID=A0A3P7KAN8_STRVU|nr:unnamed protein product [Strongylus vulgaris]
MSTTAKMRFSMDSILAAAEAKTRKRSAEADEADVAETVKKPCSDVAFVPSPNRDLTHTVELSAAQSESGENSSRCSIESPVPSTSSSPEDLSCPARKCSPEKSEHPHSERSEGCSKDDEPSSTSEDVEENHHRELEPVR